MAIQSVVACSEVKVGGLLVLWQMMECILVWVVSSSLAVNNGFLFFYCGQEFSISAGQM